MGALVTSKRGDLLALGLARLHGIAPSLTAIGLSATVAAPDELARYLAPRRRGLNVRNTAFVDMFGASSFTAHVMGQRRLYAFAAARCLADGGR